MGHNCCAGQEKIEKDGYRWFFIVGGLALLFCFILKTTDDKLTNSDRDVRLGATLKELRTAQTTLPGRVTDTRQTTPFLVHEIPAADSDSSESGEHSH